MAGPKGFTLLELIIVMALIGLMLAVGIPEYMSWRAQARYREVSQSIASTLREARARALARNAQHRVEINVAGNRYRVVEGNRTIGSTAFTTVVNDWTVIQPDIVLRSAADCSATADVNLDFNANGTATQDGVCVMSAGAASSTRYRISVDLATTGRVTMTRL